MHRSPGKRVTSPTRAEQPNPQPLVGSGTITAIERQPRGNRFNVFVDGVFALALTPETLAAAGLHTGAAVAGNDLMELQAADLRRRALDAALRLLGYRPRSQQELQDRLARRGLPPDVIRATLARLRELGFVNDEAFARAYVEGHRGASARGGRRLQSELRRKGVAAGVAEQAIAEQDEAAAARAAAEKKLRSLRGLDYLNFRNRLAGYLQRRGFGYDVIRPLVQDLWRIHNGSAPDDDGTPWD